MNWKAFVGLVVFIAVVAILAVREEERGTFDVIEREFLSWLVSNTGQGAELPPMTLVLYDVETSMMSGEERLGELDGALFARAASRLGAVAAGIEGMSGDVVRVVNAARGMRVFGGYVWDVAPREGWVGIRGEVGTDWPEVSGHMGRPGRYGRGFIMPVDALSRSHRLQLVARNGEYIVPSFLTLAWAAAEGGRPTEIGVEDGWLKVDGRKLPLDRKGGVFCFSEVKPVTMGLSEVLLEAERLERVGGESKLRGQILVLVRATTDVVRIGGEGMLPATTGELWGRGWDAVRSGKVFLVVGWWYGLLLVLGGCALVISPWRRSNFRALLGAGFAVCVFCLAALGVFASWVVFLPLVPVLLAIGSGLLAARIGYVSGWLGK